jgi:hypothetical protein
MLIVPVRKPATMPSNLFHAPIQADADRAGAEARHHALEPVSCSDSRHD